MSNEHRALLRSIYSIVRDYFDRRITAEIATRRVDQERNNFINNRQNRSFGRLIIDGALSIIEFAYKIISAPFRFIGRLIFYSQDVISNLLSR
jgi:hypothetical protein